MWCVGISYAKLQNILEMKSILHYISCRFKKQTYLHQSLLRLEFYMCSTITRINNITYTLTLIQDYIPFSLFHFSSLTEFVSSAEHAKQEVIQYNNCSIYEFIYF